MKFKNLIIILVPVITTVTINTKFMFNNTIERAIATTTSGILSGVATRELCKQIHPFSNKKKLRFFIAGLIWGAIVANKFLPKTKYDLIKKGYLLLFDIKSNPIYKNIQNITSENDHIIKLALHKTTDDIYKIKEYLMDLSQILEGQCAKKEEALKLNSNLNKTLAKLLKYQKTLENNCHQKTYLE